MEYLHFKLKNQSAQDIRSYDVIKDIERVENYCLKENIENGYVITLTNDKSYWKPYSKANPETNAYNFNLGHNRILEGLLTWAEKTSPGTKKGREKPLNIKGKYQLLWEEYSSINIKNGLFKILILNINAKKENSTQ